VFQYFEIFIKTATQVIKQSGSYSKKKKIKRKKEKGKNLNSLLASMKKKKT